LSSSSEEPKTTGAESIFRKLVLGAVAIVGIGYILTNIGGALMLGYFLSTRSIITVEILPMSGAILFLIALIVLVIMGVFLVLGGLQYFRGGGPPQEVMFFGTLMAAFYLLCLGIGSALLLTHMSLNIALLITAPVILMVGTAIYMIPSLRMRLVGSVLGIVGGTLLAVVMFDPPTLKLVLGVMNNMWNEVPFSGPFMSMSFLEGIAIVLGSLAAFVHSIFAERKEDLLTHVILGIAGLVYGIGVFVGSLVLSFSFLDLLWKAPWLGPFHDVPGWIFGTGVFWSASLVILVIGGIALIICACLGFALAAQEFSQRWLMPYSTEKLTKPLKARGRSKIR
jgi:hypothetical protein